ncbi:MAG TPA: sigma-70 family RNA polymerase sigma factor [Candidatus Dormibacteraeota bacterium]|nr:sigma-70 family RNA polymerase sigma factor [Candidatus Dormibacteraeota bacterium]
MPSSDESALISEARNGSSAAFEELVRRYDRGVLRLALSIVRSQEDARDIYQEAFLRAFRSIRSFRSECSFKTWLFRIVTNLCLDRARRDGGRLREPDGRPAGTEEGRGPGAEPLVADTSPAGDPERMLAAAETRRRVGEALRALPGRERLVFELRHDQGLRLAAVAEILETTEETVRNCLYRAHQRLREALRDLKTTAGVRGRAAPRAAPGLRLPGESEPVNGVE